MNGWLPVINQIGHIAIRVRALEAAVSFASQVMGMREVERVDDCAYLTLGDEHHSVQYIASDRNGLDHLGLQAAGPTALAAVRERVDAAGLEIVSPTPLDRGVSDGFAFIGPDDVVYEVYCGMARDQRAFYPTGVRPDRLGHFTLHPKDPEAVREFLIRVLDFRLTDIIASEGYFLRCNSDHHGLGLFEGPGTLHHHAWKVQSVAELGRIADLLDEHRLTLLWGPVRHGAGNNIAVYFLEPAGSVVEYYADMEQILEEGTFQPRTWQSTDPRWYSLWSAGRPEGFRDHGLWPVIPGQPASESRRCR
jgi:catechol-2,3-dioxygenase